MIKYFSFVIVALIVFACQDVKKPEKPQNLISKEAMADILTDLYISNASRSINNKRLKEHNVKLDSLIYKKYEIDSLQFVESNAYYSTDLKVYGQLLKTVEERLTILHKEKDSIYEIEKKEKEKEDSIAGIKKEEPKVKTGLLIDSMKSD